MAARHRLKCSTHEIQWQTLEAKKATKKVCPTEPLGTAGSPGTLVSPVSLPKLRRSTLLSLAAPLVCGFYWRTLGLTQRLGKAPTALRNGV